MTINNGRSGWGDLLVEVFGKEYCVKALTGKREKSLCDLLDPKIFLKSFVVTLTDEQRELLDKFLEILTDQERDIISLRYGLNGGPVETLAKIGEKLSLTKMQVSNRLSHIENKIRSHGRKRVELFLVPKEVLQEMLREEMEKISSLRVEISQYKSNASSETPEVSEVENFDGKLTGELLRRLDEMKEEERSLHAELDELKFIARCHENIDDISLLEFAERVKLSTRSFNALYNAELRTFGEIRKSSLEGIANLGENSQIEVREKRDEFAKAFEV